jgi:hypothetical protein
MKLIASVIIVIALLGLMAYTNPSIDEYNTYIRQSIVKEGQKPKTDPVSQLLSPLLGGIAGTLVTSQTVRTDYVFFSIYEVRLGNERLKALGVLKNFVLLEKPDVKSPKL